MIQYLTTLGHGAIAAQWSLVLNLMLCVGLGFANALLILIWDKSR